MANAQTDGRMLDKPLRLWPGVVAVVLQWLVRFVLPIFAPDAGAIAIIGGLVGGVAVIVWWLFFSRAPWAERLGAIVLMLVVMVAAPRVVHPSIANGMMGMMPFVFAIPLLSLALVAAAAAGRRLPSGPRRAVIAGAILLAGGVLTVVRTGGITGDAVSDLHWRWTPTPEERLLARNENAPVRTSPPRRAETPEPALPAHPIAETNAPASAPAAAATPVSPQPAPAAEKPPAPREAAAAARAEAEWPGFRGPNRDDVIRNVRIETDWSRTPPVELWRRPIGPGWSSFAVQGDRLYTQEQRGDDEIVASYNLTTGAPVWRHVDAARFWESNGGAGPRATPTLNGGRVYTLGATGIVNALDANDGAVVWSRDVGADTGRKVPGWGFAGSPLVVDDVVIVAAAGGLAAYDIDTGNPRWFGPSGGWGYSSPHLATIDSVTQVLLLNGEGAISVSPSDGTLLWKHAWPGDSIVQPAVIADHDVLIGSGSGLSGGTGMRRVSVAHGPGGWTVQERWTSNGLKPYFNDFVVHQGHAFGFDGSILACIDLENGERKWKGGRYGHGQLVLLPDQDVLLVLSEEGEVALVRATPDKFTELARFQVLEGKTWNHPVVVGDLLLVRNGEEMAAFRLPHAGSVSP